MWRHSPRPGRIDTGRGKWCRRVGRHGLLREQTQSSPSGPCPYTDTTRLRLGSGAVRGGVGSRVLGSGRGNNRFDADSDGPASECVYLGGAAEAVSSVSLSQVRVQQTDVFESDPWREVGRGDCSRRALRSPNLSPLAPDAAGGWPGSVVMPRVTVLCQRESVASEVRRAHGVSEQRPIYEGISHAEALRAERHHHLGQHS